MGQQRLGALIPFAAMNLVPIDRKIEKRFPFSARSPLLEGCDPSLESFQLTGMGFKIRVKSDEFQWQTHKLGLIRRGSNQQT